MPWCTLIFLLSLLQDGSRYEVIFHDPLSILLYLSAIKDEELSNLEHDKMELLHQMKQASLRPDARHLSDQSSHSLSVTSTKPPTAE